MEEKNTTFWTISVGTYPGILFGMRTYEMIDCTAHVLYLPFVDLTLTSYAEPEDMDQD